MQSSIYGTVNACVGLAALYFAGQMLAQGGQLAEGAGWLYFLPGMALILFAQMQKAFRIYLLLLAYHMDFRRFWQIYVKTTFVNLALPFKLGELFRIFSYGTELGSAKLGCLTVLLDRCFDSLALAVFLCAAGKYLGAPLSLLAIGLLGFIAAVASVYSAFPGGYTLLNHWLILQTASERGLAALRILDRVNAFYQTLDALIRQRVALLLVLSFGAWASEFLAFCLVLRAMGQERIAEPFFAYLNGMLYVRETESSVYLAVCLAACFLAAALLYGYFYLKPKEARS